MSVQDRRNAQTDPGGMRGPRRAASPPPPPDDQPPRGRRAKSGGGPNKMRVLAWVSIGLTGVVVAGSLTGYTLYRDALGSINKKNVNEQILNPRPANSTGALNILLVGSDTRDGQGNARYGQLDARRGAGKRTDTIILMHISPNRDGAKLISFPRDSMVDIPRCKNETTGAIMPPHRDMINSAYNAGGIACTISTLETLTGIPIQHFAEVDFSGFKNIVDALGGIEICLKSGVNDKKSKLVLPPGKSVLDGEKALGFVRLRNYGDGSDIQRIRRQQLFLGKVVAKATSGELLTNVPKLSGFVKAAGQSVTMDPGLADDPEKLIQIAQSAAKMTAGDVKFITVPWGADPADANRVVWKQPAANELFNMIKTDVDIVEPEPTPTGSAKPKLALKPDQVQVQVLNGTATQGKAREVADQLTKEGFRVVSLGNYKPATGSVAKTELRYGKKATNGADYAGVVGKAASPAVTPTKGGVEPLTTEPYTSTVPAGKPVDGGKPPVIQLIVGDDWKGVKVTKVSEDVKQNTVSANQSNVCIS
ncbi:LCP family protein [Nonomuraea endophytica]|uniref:LCP family protein required for cell wall assembly n=1 Tax=Nonomuraea endophytica TaxID=714136 RepID=A0A7W8ECW9_9ACTN|nr:LCP family protein [Nonomuraea endophytica]MBB5074783.1 LCP family protein required for cell wall assembly [Nonomuraea endophytica]